MAVAPLEIHPAGSTRWDLVALGEVMLRLDPGEGRIATTRSFTAWEGGGEYNVARGLARCFGLSTAIVTAFADNPIGRLVEDLIRQGGVDRELIRWVPYDGIGRTVRNGLNVTERGFGIRAALGVSDRGHTAASQLRPGVIDWDAVFAEGPGRGARWFHTGGIFAGLSESTAAVAAEAMAAARRHGTVVSYDLNYRPSLWAGIGGAARAREVNRELVGLVDVLLGNEEDFTAALGFEVEGVELGAALDAGAAAAALTAPDALDPASFGRMMTRVVREFPNLRVVATTLRRATTATRNDWGAVCWADGVLHEATRRPDLEILDRVGGGDSFASGLAFGFLAGLGAQAAVEYGAAHGALAMTTPGDTSMVTRAEVEQVMKGAGARIAR
jgi:2-dehydro-3-deoxygluconokinase